MPTPNDFQNLLQYTRWANDCVFAALDKCGDQVPPSSLRLISHIANVQSIWLTRMQNRPLIVNRWDEHDLEKCKQLNTQTLSAYKVLLDQPIDLDRKIAYTNFAGVACEDVVSDMLLQAFNHGTYHRGQIAWDLRQQGFEPVNTDYISFVRI